jgi:ELWxxDGT repeat protein
MKKKIYLLGLALLVAGSAMATTEIKSFRNGIRWTADGNPTMNIDYNTHHRTAKDIVVAGAGSSYKAFFAGSTTAAGEELWVTDGRNADTYTHMVKDICSGTTGSDVKYLARFNDKVVFSANNGTNGAELWISDGTETETTKITDLNNSGLSDPIGMTQIDAEHFVFGAYTTTNTTYRQLWISNGKTASVLKDCKFIYPGTNYNTSGHTAPVMRVGNKVFFKGDDAAGTDKEALWVTDGTADGTHKVMSVSGTTDGSHIDYMINYYNQKLFFAAGTPTLYPYMTDGVDDSETHTKKLSDNPLWNNVGGPYNGKVFYRYDHDLRAADWNGVTSYPLPTGYNDYYPISGVEYKGRYYFGIEKVVENTDLGQLAYLDLSDETPAITVVPTADGANNVISEMMVCAGTLWWINQATTTSFKIDNTTDTPGPADSNIGNCDNLRNLNGTMLFNNSPSSNSAQNLLDFWGWKKDGYDAATEADNLSLNFDSPFPTSMTATQIEPIIGERAITLGDAKATSSTTWFSNHYKLTFPGTSITWSQTIPTDYTIKYSITLNERTITGTCSTGTNTLKLYGIKGQTTAPIKFTYTLKDGTSWNKEESVTLEYFGKDAITDNEVNIENIGTVLYKSGQAVASVQARDYKTGGYIPSYYAPMKATGESDGAAIDNYNNTSITPVSTDKTKNLSIINISEMQAKKIYLMTPSFSDVAATTTAGSNLTKDVSVNYAVVPHYLMVTTGPYTKAEMDNSIVKTVEGTINTLQDSWTVSSAPALNLESAGKARIKAVSTTADNLYDNATDVEVASIAGGTEIKNHQIVTFIANKLTPTGIEGITADAVTIIGGEGMITVNGAKNVTVLNAMGQIIKQTTGRSEIDVPSGLYIVRADATTMKVLVK